MVKVLEINNKIISALKENELQYKDLILSYIKGEYNEFIYAEANNITLAQFVLSNETICICYNEEKNTVCRLDENMLERIYNVFDYEPITIDDFSVVNH